MRLAVKTVKNGSSEILCAYKQGYMVKIIDNIYEIYFEKGLAEFYIKKIHLKKP